MEVEARKKGGRYLTPAPVAHGSLNALATVVTINLPLDRHL